MFTEAQEQYADSNYTKTIEICNRILAINSELVGVQMLLSYVYDDIKKPQLELQHLNEAQKLNDHPYIKWRLGELYYKLGNYSEALYYYNQYKNYKYISEKTRLTLACKRANCIFTIQSLKNYAAGNQSTEPEDIYWAAPSPDGKKLVFINESNGLETGKQTDNFISEIDTLNNEFSEQGKDSMFTGENGSETLTENSDIIFFTGYNRSDGFGDADIYLSHFVDGKWSAPMNAGSSLNSEKSESQPNFDFKTRQLYFTSNRSGGVGENDIWKVELIRFANDGSPVWSVPENLNGVNTTGNEISPFFYSKTGQLYFASDGNFGMGGYDLFEVGVDESGSVGGTVNLGYPINTKADELSGIVNSISDTAFFTVGRTKNEGLEIFAFNLTRGLRTGPNYYVHVKVANQNSKLPVQTYIEIVNNNRNADNTFESVNENGERMLCLKANRSYTFSVSEIGFMFFSKTISLDKSNTISNPLNFLIELEPIEVGSEIDLYNIYYETNSYAILPNSKSELNRLVLFLKSNNKLKVEIQGHTDSSGNSENNMILSKNRAKSVVDYLVENGINSSRLKYNGYGDTVPVASNETEEGRQLNRRTTIKIIEK
jgi:outer membrane protein OmpA-like peptidoglycan-associated protein